MGFLEQDLTIEAAKYPLARLSTRLKAVVRRLSYFFKTATTCSKDVDFLPSTGLLNEAHKLREPAEDVEAQHVSFPSPR